MLLQRLDAQSAGPLAVAANQNEDIEEPWSTYLHLWQAILQSSTSTTPSTQASRVSSSKAVGPKLGLHACHASPADAAAKQQAVYDALIRVVMDAVRNLDLEYHQADTSMSLDVQDKLASPVRSNTAGQVHCFPPFNACGTVTVILAHCTSSTQSAHPSIARCWCCT